MRWSVIILLTLTFCVSCDPPEEQENHTRKPDAPRSLDRGEAITFAKDCVRNSLLCPSTADFPWFDTQISEGPNYIVSSYVDSANAFGATVRMNWVAKVHKDRGTWELDYLQIDDLILVSNYKPKELENNTQPAQEIHTNMPIPSSQTDNPDAWFLTEDPPKPKGYDPPYRMWKSRSGSAIKVKLVEFSEDETEITLKREDEKVFTLKISQLTDFDASQAKKYIARKKRLDGTNGD